MVPRKTIQCISESANKKCYISQLNWTSYVLLIENCCKYITISHRFGESLQPQKPPYKIWCHLGKDEHTIIKIRNSVMSDWHYSMEYSIVTVWIWGKIPSHIITMLWMWIMLWMQKCYIKDVIYSSQNGRQVAGVMISDWPNIKRIWLYGLSGITKMSSALDDGWTVRAGEMYPSRRFQKLESGIWRLAKNSPGTSELGRCNQTLGACPHGSENVCLGFPH